MWKKIGYTLLAIYVIILILIALFFKGINSIPKDIPDQDRKLWKVSQDQLIKNSDDLYAKYEIAILCAYNNKLEKSGIYLNEIITTDRNFGNEAVLHYSNILKNNSNDWHIMFKLAIAHYMANGDDDKKEILSLLKRILKIVPDNPWMNAYYGYAIAAYEGRFQDAVNYINKSVKIDNDVAVFHFLLSEGYSKLGNKELAKEHKNIALKLKLKGK